MSGTTFGAGHYRVPNPPAQAALLLQENGGDVRSGLRVQFWYVYGGVKVRNAEFREINVGRYSRLIDLAVEEGLGNWLEKRDRNIQYRLPTFIPFKNLGHPVESY